MNTLETYKVNYDFKKITLEMISKITALGIPENNKFNFCKISLAQAIINPLKVSYIKQDKIKSLMEHAKVILPLSPTAEQRNKYFNACSLEKFANHIFDKKGITADQLSDFNSFVKRAKEKANLTLTKELKTFEASEIPDIYNINNGSDSKEYNGYYITENNGINSSCMQGKPKKYFEIYTDLNEDIHALEMATLTQGNEIVARALVWFDISKDELKTGEEIHPRSVYIDRIYTKTQEHREETQAQLYFEILKRYNISINKITEVSTPSGPKDRVILPNCFNANNITKLIISKLNINKEVIFNSYCGFDVESLNNDYAYYPYLDSLQYFNTDTHCLSADEDDGAYILKLESTSGDAIETHTLCDNCGAEMSRDDERYIETEEMTVCECCAVYCDERDEYILESDAIYNNHSGQYHYSRDLDI